VTINAGKEENLIPDLKTALEKLNVNIIKFELDETKAIII
jgi:hypothetical protein